jgi:SAM-dependent methyltransferase
LSAHAEGGNTYTMHTLDIQDFNDPAVWRRYGAAYSPAGMAEQMGRADQVTFHVTDALHYLTTCDERFDLIFLDGDHSPAAVYREIPAALRVLNPGGYILLHDYFPDFKPLYGRGSVVPGPFLAVQRLQREGVPVTALPLGELPWPTKRTYHVTSLALLGKS